MYICMIFLYIYYIRQINGKCNQPSDGNWSIGILFGEDPFSLHSPNGIKNKNIPCIQNPILSCDDINDVNASYVADPFLHINSVTNEWHLFFEVKNFDANKGEIGSAVSKDKGRTWSYLGIVLTETWHLAYPFIFEYQDKIYMLPDATANLRLYVATDFPLKWRFSSQLLPRRLVDTSIVQHNGLWWMIGTVGSHIPTMHIYYSNNPLSRWTATDHNCIVRQIIKTTNDIDQFEYTCRNTKKKIPHVVGIPPSIIEVRNGGRMFHFNSSLYRIAQRHGKNYGDGLDLYRIDRIAVKEKIAESIVEKFSDSLRSYGNVGSWNSKKYHHMDIHNIGDNNEKLYVAVIDGDNMERHKSDNNVVIVDYKC